MTRPRCPKCQKYYVTQTFERPHLPSRTAGAIKRSLRRKQPPVSPYRRYSCDICGHCWAVLIAGTATQPPQLTTATESMRFARTGPVGAMSPASVSARSGVTTRSGRSGTLMAAHPAASQRVRRPAAESSTTEYRTRVQGAVSYARLATAPTSTALDLAEVPEPLSTETSDDAPASRWQELWRFILPS